FASLTGDLLLDALVGALFALLTYSSLAAVLLTATLAGAGLISLPVAIGLVIGANIGSGLLAFLTSSLQNPAGRRVALGSLIYRLLGLLLVLPVLQPLAHWLDSLNWRPAELVIFFHLLYNSLRAVLMLPSVGLMARFCNWLLPDRPDDGGVARLRHLDPTALETPSLALANGVRETLRVGDIIEAMLGRLLPVLAQNQPALSKELRSLNDDVASLCRAVKLYLAQISREGLSDQESRRWAEILELAVNLEQSGELIERMLGKIQHEKTAQRRAFSEKGLEELTGLHGQLMANLRLALNVFLSADQAA